ncbi:MAG TPA: serine hydrolase domain-containing protein [Ktedonobacteraceae bacterium]
MREAHVPGLGLSLMRDARVAWQGFWGRKRADSEEPVTEQTIFQAASLSKPLFAYAVLSLAQQGTFDLDRPLTAYLPAASLPDDPLVERISGRVVLCHLSGWPNWREEGQPLTRLREPGKRFGYSGEGFGYLQQAIEALTGLPLETFMQQTACAPLGLARSSYLWTAGEQAACAGAHDATGQPMPPFSLATPHAAASLHTTPADYARFLCAMLEPGKIPGSLPLARGDAAPTCQA